MSASERLRELWAEPNDRAIWAVVPQIVAVVEAAEERQRLLAKLAMPEPSRYVTPTEFDLNGQRMRAALTALEEALS